MKRISWLMAALAILLAVGVASAQAPPPPPKPAEQEKPKPPAKKAKKVWTGDDLKELKTPADEYSEKKAAEEAAKAEEAKAAAKPEAEAEEPPRPEEIDPKTGKRLVDPDSLEGLQKQLDGWEAEVKRTEALAEDARREMTSAPNQEAWESAKTKMETYEQNVADIQQKIADLRVRIEAKKKEGTPAARPPAPQGSPASL